MSKLDNLVQQLSPAGVKYMLLEEVWIKAPKSKKGVGSVKVMERGDIICFTSGKQVFYVDDYLVDGKYIFMNDGGKADTNYYDGRAYYTDHTFTFTVDESVLEPKFVYYVLSENEKYINEVLFKGSGLKNLNKKALAKFQVPLPSRKVQQEIVTTLDKFAALVTELEAERSMRLRQFEYYRDELMAFDNQDNVKFKPLSEIGKFTRGRRFTKADYSDTGIGCIHYGEIYTHYGISTTSVISYVRSELAPSLRYAHYGDLIIASVGETVEEVAKAVAWLGNGEIAIHDDSYAFSHSLNPKFVSYYFQTARFHSEKNKHVARAKVKRVSSDGLGKILIPVPPQEDQDRIVKILDEFDALLNDSSIGLPIEIAARRRQHEYYRNKLLTFHEANA